MHLDGWTVLLQTVNFAVLIWLLHRFLYRPVFRIGEARRAQVQRELAQGRALAEQAQTQLADIQRQRLGIAAEREAVLQAAVSQAQQAAAARGMQAEREAQATLAQARRTLIGEREQAVRESQRTALQLGAEVALRLLAELPRELQDEAWLARIAEFLVQLPAERLQELRSQLCGDARLELCTAHALQEAAQGRWRERLQHLLGNQVKVDFVVDDALLAGAELRFPQARLSFSWQGALAALGQQLQGSEPSPSAAAPQPHAHAV